MNFTRRCHSTLTSAVLLLFATQFCGLGLAQARPMSPVPLQNEGDLPPLGGATTWLNSRPLTPADLRGKVVLFDFWTYSCINSLRTLPYVRAWAEKYKTQGLVVVGVHAPEFTFEKNLNNVRWAVKDMKIEFPVAVDSDHAVWAAFNNQYWPALYFVDAHGQIRHHQFGEGQYEESEAVIQQLLGEARGVGISRDFVAVDPRGDELGADWSDIRSPESYVGYERADDFASPGGARPNKAHGYILPTGLNLNSWALSGDWTMGREAAVLDKPNGRVAYRFHARDLHLVMGPLAPGTSVRFRVLVDGRPPGDAHGGDVSSEGLGTITNQKLYQLIRQSKPISDHLFEIEFLDAGAQVFDFTFG